MAPIAIERAVVAEAAKAPDDAAFVAASEAIAADFAADLAVMKDERPPTVGLPSGEELAARVAPEFEERPAPIVGSDHPPVETVAEPEEAPSRADRVSAALRLSREAARAWADLIRPPVRRFLPHSLRPPNPPSKGGPDPPKVRAAFVSNFQKTYFRTQDFAQRVVQLLAGGGLCNFLHAPPQRRLRINVNLSYQPLKLTWFIGSVNMTPGRALVPRSQASGSSSRVGRSPGCLPRPRPRPPDPVFLLKWLLAGPLSLEARQPGLFDRWAGCLALFLVRPIPLVDGRVEQLPADPAEGRVRALSLQDLPPVGDGASGSALISRKLGGASWGFFSAMVGGVVVEPPSLGLVGDDAPPSGPGIFLSLFLIKGVPDCRECMFGLPVVHSRFSGSACPDCRDCMHPAKSKSK